MEEEVRLRASAVNVPELNGVLPTSSPATSNSFHSFFKEFFSVITYHKSRKVCIYGILNIITTIVLLLWCSVTNSMALTAFTYVTIFDIFLLATCLVTIWVQTKRPSPAYSFGYERFEVLAVFASTLLAQLGSFFIMKESVERLIQQPDVHEGRLLPATALAFTVHMIITYSSNNSAFQNVITASSSSWLQEHVTDISESLCHVVPGVSKLLLPRLNPFSLIGVFSTAALVIVFFLIDIKNYHASDTWAAIWIAIMTCGTMFPMSVYTAKILLQTTPSHSLSQLDKCIREAQTLDGVLEFRHEHFWTLSFGMMAGSVQVRVRRDADEQMVLAHVYHRLVNIIPVLTVHIFKDEWTSKANLSHTMHDYPHALSQNIADNRLPVLPAPLMTSTPNHPSTLSLYRPNLQQQSALSNYVPLSRLNIGSQQLNPVATINAGSLNPQVLGLIGSSAGQDNVKYH